MNKKIFFCLLLLFFVFVVSCKKNKEIVFDNSHPLALATDVQWAVVSVQYVALRKNPDFSADVTSHTRKGDILKIEGKKITDDGIWYKVEGGYIFEKSVEIYANRFKASTATSSNQ